MASDVKLTDLTELVGSDMTPDDEFLVVDVSDGTMDAAGTTKRIKASGIITGIANTAAFLQPAQNLADLVSPATARTSLGLGTAAVAATTDFDAAGIAIPKSTVTTAGDLLVATGSGVVARQAVGATPGTALIPDTAATNKVSYGYPSSVELAFRGSSGSFSSSYDRSTAPGAVGRTLTGGRIELVRMFLVKGQVVTTIRFWCSAAGSGLTHQWFALFDSGRNLLGVTSDDTSVAWSSSAVKALNLAAPYTATATGWYYAGVCVTTGTSLPTIVSYATTLETTILRAAAPVPCFAGDSSLTTPGTCPATITSAGIIGNMHYCEFA